MTERTQIVSVHALRRRARVQERRLQAALDRAAGDHHLPSDFHLLRMAGVPSWARGVRVERAGWFQHAVVATDGRGH